MGQLLNRPDLIEITAMIKLRAFAAVAEAWRDVPGKHVFNEPYMLGFNQGLAGAAQEAVKRGATSPIEVIFDDHPAYRHVFESLYPKMWAHMDDPRVRSVLPVQAMFRDDREYVILQAADLVAGQLRIAAERKLKAPSWVLDACPQLRVSKFSAFFNEERLPAISAEMRARFDRGELLDD